jgi:hypothetical protein
MGFIENLGLKGRDKITGFEGYVCSVSFDLYGCVSYWITPPAKTEPGDLPGGQWFDEKRVELTESRIMPVPDFVNIPGPAIKSPPPRA